MANNQVPPCPFSTMAWLQLWVSTPVKRHPLQDFGPEIGGGRLPQGGPTPRTLRYRWFLSRQHIISETWDFYVLTGVMWSTKQNHTSYPAIHYPVHFVKQPYIFFSKVHKILCYNRFRRQDKDKIARSRFPWMNADGRRQGLCILVTKILFYWEWMALRTVGCGTNGIYLLRAHVLTHTFCMDMMMLIRQGPRNFHVAVLTRIIYWTVSCYKRKNTCCTFHDHHVFEVLPSFFWWNNPPVGYPKAAESTWRCSVLEAGSPAELRLHRGQQ